MPKSIDGQLLDDIRADVGITWHDEATERDLRNKISLGVAHINKLAGASCDYRDAGTPRELLFAYVRYARADAIDVFDNNYRPMILAMQAERRLTRFAQEHAAATE